MSAGESQDLRRSDEGRDIQRIAIVNRGEAAMRCVRAVKSLREREQSDLVAIALFTASDCDAPFVRHADFAHELDDSRGAVAAYLDHDALLEALHEVQADAVWPGWGFVAEDANFVERLRSEGIAFLGPRPEAMRAVGDKIAAKKLAESAQVAVSKWSGGALADAAEAAIAAERIGYPVVLKASAGGGGRGIRMVYKPEEIAAAFESASSEATNAFGDGRLFCEALVVDGRHIEVQMAADLHGNVRAVGSRDCSVQRRHQKVLEEAPPPGIAPEVLEAIESSAVRIGREVNYSGVGTVEFLLSGSEFVFLEVNPRLQVEHGITEELTGIDLVQLQIRIARGESIGDLPLSQRGVAIEARVCAEDPDQNFIPSPGRIACFEAALSSGVRVDTGVASGTTVPAAFDSLVAKVISVGKDREDAIARLSCALRDLELVIEGGATNKGYLLEILASEDYRRGGVDTAWLDRWSAKRRPQSDGGEVALVAAAILAYQRARALARLNFYSDPTSLSAERVPPSQGQQIDLSVGSESYRLEVYATGSWGYRVHLEGKAVTAMLREEGSHSVHLVIDGGVHRVLYDATEVGLWLELDGHPHRFGWQTLGQVRSSTPAMVVAVNVAVGDSVEAGQALGLLEAMKMEIGFESPVSGTVTEIHARKGQKVAAGELMLVIEPASEGDADSSPVERLELPEQVDSLAALFTTPTGAEGSEKRQLGVPDLAAIVSAEAPLRRRALRTLREEVRRILLGYDLNRDRGEALVEFLEADLPEELPRELLLALTSLRRELPVFVDVERLFIRSPRASVSGELGPSNNARLRVYLRRMRGRSTGIAEGFLDLLRNALAHYGLSDLETSDAHERALLRVLASQLDPDLRRRLVQGLVQLLTSLSERVDLSNDSKLEAALEDLGAMRGLVPDALADAAIDARYSIFEAPRMERRIEPSSKELESWLSSAETRPTLPPDSVLHELAVAPQTLFARVGQWLESPAHARRGIALAAHLQRRYAAATSLERGSQGGGATNIQWVRVPERGVVLAASCSSKDVAQGVACLLEGARTWKGEELLALELLVTSVEAESASEVSDGAATALAGSLLPCRFTVEAHCDDHNVICRTFAAGSQEQGSARFEGQWHDVHPEVAERIDLARYSAFELERLATSDGIYAFFGRSTLVPKDERLFVLADVPGRFPQAGHELEPHLAAFERAFHRATSSLRGIIQERDPRRRLQWNRIGLYVSAAVRLDRETAAALGRRLAPATRNLGLEKLLVTLNVLDPKDPAKGAQPIELVFTDPTGQQMEVTWRAPHHAALAPAEEYVRRMVKRVADVSFTPTRSSAC